MAENKQLRDYAAVPDNFGKNREDIRLINKEKIDDFKKLVRILQEDNYTLEEERAKLKHRVKEMSMLMSDKNQNDRYANYGLSADKMA